MSPSSSVARAEDVPQATPGPRVAYLVKRYPRYSETFIVNEVLAHEAADFDLAIFALKPCNDAHFQDAISRVRAPVRILESRGLKPNALWAAMTRLSRARSLPVSALERLLEEDVALAYQSMLLAEAVRMAGIQHVHAHFGTSPATVAALAAELAGVSYSFTAHAKDLYHDDFDLERFRARHADRARVVTISEYNRRHLIEQCGFDPERVTLVHNGLDLERFAFTPRRPAPRRPRITAIGRLVEKKGFDVLVDACRLLADRDVEFECSIVGEGPLQEALERRITEAGLSGRVRLLGPLPQERAVELLAASEVFAAPCVIAEDGDRDGVPTTILEAMALGVPCISTDVTGIPEVVQHGKTGIVVTQHDVEGLANAIERVIGDEALGRDLALAGRQLIERRFDARTNTATLREVFARCGRDRPPLDRPVGEGA